MNVEWDMSKATVTQTVEEAKALQAALQGLADALRGLVKCNEEWNEAVASVIGKPGKWADTYLNEARAALDAAKPFLEEK